MFASVEAGLFATGVIPGKLKLKESLNQFINKQSIPIEAVIAIVF